MRTGVWCCLLAVGAGVSGLITGCANVLPRKVPVASQYENWTDQMQADADAMPGVRYYMARPYVVVHRPFPLHAESFLVDGVATPDGQHIRLTGDLSAEKFAPLRHAVDASGALSTRAIFDTTKAAKSAPQPQSATVGGLAGSVPTPNAASTDADDSASDRQAAPPKKTGITSLHVGTELNAVGHFPLRDFIDLVYLPDFEEQYVIAPDGGLGVVDIGLTQGPGGVLMALGLQADNSAVTAPLVDAYSGLLKAGTIAAKAAINSAMGLPIPQSSTVAAPALDASMAARDIGDAPQTVVTLKVTVVKFAAPGLYPVLKPAEFNDLKPDPNDPSSVLPQYPYASVAYKHFQTIVVEHLITDEPTEPVVSFDGSAPSGRDDTDPNPTGAAATNLSGSDNDVLQAVHDEISRSGIVTDPQVTIDTRRPQGTGQVISLNLNVTGQPSVDQSADDVAEDLAEHLTEKFAARFKVNFENTTP